MDAEGFSNSALDLREYRGALGGYATGVALVSIYDSNGETRAITVNSFTSVSLEPPIILWCMDERSDRHDKFVHAERFAINVLSGNDQELANLYAKDPDAELPLEHIVRGKHGVPVLETAVTTLECERRWLQRAGDHTVVFATVLDFVSRGGEALGYYHGKYTTIRQEG